MESPNKLQVKVVLFMLIRFDNFQLWPRSPELNNLQQSLAFMMRTDFVIKITFLTAIDLAIQWAF